VRPPGPRRDRPQAGFTLIELMIALLLFSFAIAGILSVAVTTTRSFREQRRIIQTEQAVRAPLDFIVDAIRQVSPGVPTIVGNANLPSLRNSFPPCPGVGAVSFVDNTNAPDELEIVYASGGIVTTAHSAVSATSNTVLVPSAHVDQFAAGDFLVISDGVYGTLLKVTGVTGNTLQIAADSSCADPAQGFPVTYPIGSLIVRAQRARFTVERFDGDPNQPWTLYMDPDGAGPLAKEPIAEGVEDMQIAIGVDTDNDNFISEVGQVAGDDEWIGNVAGEVLPLGTIRAVRIALVAYDTKDITGQASFYRPSALNRPGTETPEKRRRRVLMSTVDIRNLSELP
jgi:prepilin-type N-terminal cleavage/methylation domain-containing protein